MKLGYRHAVDVAEDITLILCKMTNYIVQTILTEEGVIVKVGNTANKQARTVNVTQNRDKNNNFIQDKLLAVKLAYRLHKSLKQ